MVNVAPDEAEDAALLAVIAEAFLSGRRRESEGTLCALYHLGRKKQRVLAVRLDLNYPKPSARLFKG